MDTPVQIGDLVKRDAIVYNRNENDLLIAIEQLNVDKRSKFRHWRCIYPDSPWAKYVIPESDLTVIVSNNERKNENAKNES